MFGSPRIESENTHGTGCTISAAIATYLAQGRSIPEAVFEAKEFIYQAIKYAFPLGSGHGPTNHFALLARQEVIASLEQAVETLRRAGAGALIPEVRSNLGYALPNAGDAGDVAAFPGRIVRVGQNTAIIARPEFGASRYVAGMILAACAVDPSKRAAMNIRFDEAYLEKAREPGFASVGFDRNKEPEEIKNREGYSLSWGVVEAIKNAGAVPDLIFDRGGVGKEPMIRIFGKNPQEVIMKALKLLDK